MANYKPCPYPDCFHCPYPDCCKSDVRQLEKEAQRPKTAEEIAAMERAAKKSEAERIARKRAYYLRKLAGQRTYYEEHKQEILTRQRERRRAKKEEAKNEAQEI